jgi:hypothetical protein
MLSEAEEDDALLAEAQALHSFQVQIGSTRDAPCAVARKSMSRVGDKGSRRTLWRRLFCCK